MVRRSTVHEGRTKTLLSSPEPDRLIQRFKDDAPRQGDAPPLILEGKGVVNNIISEYLMQCLNGIGIPTHFVRRLNMREQLVIELEMIPIQVMIRNVAAGSLSTRFDLPEGTTLPRSIAEYIYKSEKMNYPLISEEHITAFGWAGTQDIDDMLAMALRINDFLLGLFAGVRIKLVDVTLEFGRLYDENGDMRILLGDEISPDTCRLRDMESGRELGRNSDTAAQSSSAWREIAQRLGILPADGDATAPEDAPPAKARRARA